MRHILLATDGSSGAGRAAEVAARLAKAFGAELLILTVGGNAPENEIRKLARAEGGIGEALELISNEILLQASEIARRAGATNVRTISGWGDAAQVIIETAQREQVDVIVMGRRGRGRLARLLLGSVSQKVVSLAPCVVVVAP